MELSGETSKQTLNIVERRENEKVRNRREPTAKAQIKVKNDARKTCSGKQGSDIQHSDSLMLASSFTLLKKLTLR